LKSCNAAKQDTTALPFLILRNLVWRGTASHKLAIPDRTSVFTKFRIVAVLSMPVTNWLLGRHESALLPLAAAEVKKSIFPNSLKILSNSY
jgi:hypothetical protein